MRLATFNLESLDDSSKARPDFAARAAAAVVATFDFGDARAARG